MILGVVSKDVKTDHTTDPSVTNVERIIGVSLARSRVCFQCGKEGHLAKDCPRGRTNYSRSQHRLLRITDRPTQSRPSVKAYASTSEDTENPDARVTGTLFILGHLALALFDLRSTHSFISTVFVSQTKFVLESLLHEFSIGTFSGVNMIVLIG